MLALKIDGRRIITMTKQIIKRPEPVREAQLKKALDIHYWTKAKLERLKGAMVVHSSD